MTNPVTHDPAVRAQHVAGRAVADYIEDDFDRRRCPGHNLNSVVGYVVRRTVTVEGERIIHPDGTGFGVDVYAVECGDRWGNYDKAVEAARACKTGRGWAVVDMLYRCGHRGLG